MLAQMPHYIRRTYRSDSKRPTRAQCEAVIKTVAEKHGVTEDQIIQSASRKITPIRFEVWDEIIRQTGCSQKGLAETWGIENKSIISGLRRFRADA